MREDRQSVVFQFTNLVKYYSLTADSLCSHKQNCENLENLWKNKMVFSDEDKKLTKICLLSTYETDNRVPRAAEEALWNRIDRPMRRA